MIQELLKLETGIRSKMLEEVLISLEEGVGACADLGTQPQLQIRVSACCDAGHVPICVSWAPPDAWSGNVKLNMAVGR